MRVLSLVLMGWLSGCTSGKDGVDSNLPTETDRDGDGYDFAAGDCDDDDPAINPDAEEVWYNGVDENCDGNDDDQDADNYGTGDGDCDDESADVSPAANEACDSLDNNCDGEIDEGLLVDAYPDEDDDGFGDEAIVVESCDGDVPNGYTEQGGDCDDDDEAVNPDAEEVCDGVDNDCDGSEIETVYYADADGDGFGDPAAPATFCAPTDGYADDGGTDCDDTNAAIYVGAVEIAGDEIDQNCDAAEDCYTDADGDGYGTATLVASADLSCRDAGEALSSDDCDDATASTNPGAPEQCDDGVDNDCDGLTDDADEITETTWYLDADADGYGDPTLTTLDCAQPEGYVVDGTDCDDADATLSPGAVELCDGIDNDCDGTIDDDAGTAWYADADGDTYGDPAATLTACDQPTGYVADATDCDDASAQAYPGAAEVCDEIDNNCDGTADDGVTTTYYVDVDADGYGDTASTLEACALPTGYAANADDCNDADASISPGDPEQCDDAIDNDCDTLVDADDPGLTDSTWYQDLDGDDYGDPAVSTTDCSQPAGYVLDDTDCDDADGAVNPGADELCDGADNNCDGLVDDASATDATTWYLDADADTYGDPATAETSCTAPTGGITDGTDCDDAAPDVNPGATEACNGLDDDCDGGTDEAGATGELVWYADADGDGHGDANSSQAACDQPADHVPDADDCDDANAAAYPGLDELCNGFDDNCDGTTDDDALDPSTWWLDDDGDGYGVDGTEVVACDAPTGYAGAGGDCDDNDAAHSPGTPETDDGTDENCDDLIDEAFVNEGDLVISEVYRQPRFGANSTNDDGQWFEIYNASARAIDMSSWTIARAGPINSVTDVDSFQIDPLDPVIVAPGSYAVFCYLDDYEGSTAAYPLACDYYWSDLDTSTTDTGTYFNDTFHLQRDEDSLTLYLGSLDTGAVIDEVYWYFDATNGEWSRDARFSMSLDPAALDATSNDDRTSWCSTAGAVNDTAYAWYDNPGSDDDEHGTPGAANYDCP